MNSKWLSFFFIGLLALISLAVVLSTPPPASAIPAFSRKYGTSCTTCHSDFPKLNDFGKAFKDAGFKFPKDDESFLKQPPVLLGAPAQAELWPHTVYPGMIPGTIPAGLRYNTYYQQVSSNRNNFNLVLPAGTVGNFIPKSDFQPGFFSIFTAGNFGSGIAFWVDDDISVAGANVNGALGDGYLKFIDVSRFLKMPKDSLNLRAGQFELDLPFSQARTWNLSGWDIFSEANIGVQNGLIPQFVNNGSALEDAANGVEFSGGHAYQGYHYSVAIFDQNTSGVNISPPNISPQNGVAFNSDANFKDLYGRFVYRFNLEKDPVSRNDVQAAGATGPRDHTYLSLGTIYFYGRTAQNVSGVLSDGVTPTVLTAREPFYRIGGDVNFNYRNLNVFGVYVAAHDHNLVPVTAPGAAGITGFTPEGRNIQRRILRGGLPGASLGNDDHALGPGEVERRPHQLPSIRSVRASRIVVLFAVCSHTQPVHARRAVPHSRQHQDLCRIPDHAAAGCLRPGNRRADQRTVPDERPSRRAGICLLARHAIPNFCNQENT